MQDDPVRKLKVGGGEWDDSLRKIGHLRSKCYGRITRLIPFFRCAERYFQAFNCNSPGVSGGVSSPIKQPFQAELAYAWFVASGTVTAKGMSVNVQSSGGLTISADGNAWGTIADAQLAIKTLNPTSTADFSKWSTATAESPAAKAAAQSTRQAVTVTVPTTGENAGTLTDNPYVVAKKFHIRSSNPEKLANGLYVESIEVKAIGENSTLSNPAKTMSTALRVGLECTIPGESTSKKLIFSPVAFDSSITENIPTASYKFYENAADTIGTDVNVCSVGKTGTYNGVIVDDGKTVANAVASAIQVQVYIWFEGEDNNLYSDNYHVEDLSITINFTSDSFGTQA